VEAVCRADGGREASAGQVVSGWTWPAVRCRRRGVIREAGRRPRGQGLIGGAETYPVGAASATWSQPTATRRAAGSSPSPVGGARECEGEVGL
jgi:hypothetical protein